MNSWNQPAQVYRVYDEDERLIYVGATSDVAQRMVIHEARTWWWELAARIECETFPTRPAAFAAEAVAIQEEQPVFNITGTGRPFGDFSVLTARDLEVCRRNRHDKNVPSSLLYRLVDLPASA